MQIKYTQATLDKLERIMSEGRYILRYEKGTFNSGYCVLEHKKVVVVNKFLNVEGRVNALLDILPALKLETDYLSDDARKFYRQYMEHLSESVAAPPAAGDAANAPENDEHAPNDN